MKVCVNGCYSDSHEVLSGVPQGSVLGPILFLIFVNNIGFNLKNHYMMFADDFKLVFSCSNSSHISSVQEDVNNFIANANSWGLSINISKCVILNFGYRNTDTFFIGPDPLLDSSESRDLGVTVDTSLKYHSHVQSITQKASGLACNLLKSTVCRSPEFMITLFKSHIRPILDYCSPLWNVGYIHDLILEQVQRRWT